MFHLKQFSLASVHTLIVKKHLFLTIQEVICNNSVKCKYDFNVEKQFYFK